MMLDTLAVGKVDAFRTSKSPLSFSQMIISHNSPLEWGMSMKRRVNMLHGTQLSSHQPPHVLSLRQGIAKEQQW